MMPKRIQRKRTKGWRMPAGAVYVGRPSRYGNPFSVYAGDRAWPVRIYRLWVHYPDSVYLPPGLPDPPTQQEVDALRGQDLACWCPLDQPCHADVLLEIANA
jgi:hypothetical protein